MAKTRLAILGFEHIHAHHYLQCLKSMPDVEVVGIAEPDPRSLHGSIDVIGGIPCQNDYQALLRPALVDGVLICSANVRHKQMVMDAARARIPILCEKPLATKIADAREMLAMVEAYGTPLGLCFPCRFSEPLQQARQWIEQKSLGEIIAVKATNHGTMPGGWFVDPALSGGGAIMDHTVHVVDALRWIFGQEFVRVYAQAATRLHPIAVEDVALLSLEMSHGVFVTLDASWSRPARSFPIWGDVHLSIIGTRGVFDLDLFPWTISHFSESSARLLAVSHDGDLNQRLLRHFIESIRKGTPVSPDGTDGLRALEVVEGAYESVRSGKAVFL
ncbi:MAG: Gfo/Idh/MocA family oxidoreductase [Terriglobia bacterium]